MHPNDVVCDTLWDFIECVESSNRKGKWNLLEFEDATNYPRAVYRLDNGVTQYEETK